MSDNTHQPLPQRQFTPCRGPLGPSALPSTAADLILLGDLTGRYATGSYSRLSSDRRTVLPRGDRQGAAEHGHRITAAIACHVARAGGTIDQLTQLLLHPEHEGGRHTRNIALRSGQTRALDYLRRVWNSASATVGTTLALGSRHDAFEVLAALRDRIETTPWRGERGRTALRVLRAHLNFAEIAGGPLHHASERQTAEEAGISRTTPRAVYDTVLKPQGWLRRLRVGHGREGSTWYLDYGSAHGRGAHSLSRFRTTQFPPDPALEEWTTPETATTADIDSTVLGNLMGHDAFAHHALGSAALMIISALHVRHHQTAGELRQAEWFQRQPYQRHVRGYPRGQPGQERAVRHLVRADRDHDRQPGPSGGREREQPFQCRVVRPVRVLDDQRVDVQSAHQLRERAQDPAPGLPGIVQCFQRPRQSVGPVRKSGRSAPAGGVSATSASSRGHIRRIPSTTAPG
ncbi:hypothetical protein ACIRPX_44805 [Streptomyces sp. NPDC101225]|uniref:hypothetical protein n=1 Tax=Streptomyces sp. NPDC101225 TaxID=3366135 RepID=UPI0037F3ECD7